MKFVFMIYSCMMIGYNPKINRGCPSSHLISNLLTPAFFRSIFENREHHLCQTARTKEAQDPRPCCSSTYADFSVHTTDRKCIH